MINIEKNIEFKTLYNFLEKKKGEFQFIAATHENIGKLQQKVKVEQIWRSILQ